MNLIAEFRLTKKRSFVYNILSGLLFLAGFVSLLLISYYSPDENLILNILNNHSTIIMFCSVAFVIVIHELLHGLGYKIFGGKTRCGVKLYNIYTMDVSGHYYKSGQMLVVMLLPLVVLSPLLLLLILLLPQYVYYLFIAMMFNISGSTGDVFMSAFLLRKGLNCKVRDTENGFDVFRDNGIAGENLLVA